MSSEQVTIVCLTVQDMQLAIVAVVTTQGTNHSSPASKHLSISLVSASKLETNPFGT